MRVRFGVDEARQAGPVPTSGIAASGMTFHLKDAEGVWAESGNERATQRGRSGYLLDALPAQWQSKRVDAVRSQPVEVSRPDKLGHVV